MDFINISLSLLTLIVLEIVLGIDNLVILSILVDRLPVEQRKTAQKAGLFFAWITRLLLLALAVFMMYLVTPIVSWSSYTFSIRDLFLLLGGVFLIWKATDEIHQDLLKDYAQPLKSTTGSSTSLPKVITQIALLDVVFSLDSVLTAVGLTNHYWVMALAISCAIVVMLFASDFMSRFIARYPTIKMLALSYLILIGIVLVADGLSFHIPRGYIYFAMGFSLTVEALNIMRRSR